MTLNSNNLPMMHKKPDTAIIERVKQVTAVVEHPMTEDDLTHPGLYRFKKNSMPCYTYHQPANNLTDKSSEGNTTCSSSEVDWDLYPGVMRTIENEGTPDQVEKLHQMQHNM